MQENTVLPFFEILLYLKMAGLSGKVALKLL